MELKEFLETVKVRSNLDNKQFDEQQKKLIKSFYFTYFGKKLVERCNNCFVDAYFELYNLSKNPEKIYNMENQQFQLKKGILISLHGQVKDLTRANCTDKDAIDLLKKYPGHISSFEKYPDNWQELISGKKYKLETKDENVTSEEKPAYRKKTKKAAK